MILNFNSPNVYVFTFLYETNVFKVTEYFCEPKQILFYTYNKTRMNDNIHKINKSDKQTNIGKYRVDANITEYHIVSKLNLLRIIISKS